MTSNRLQGLSVVITRPEQQALTLQQAIEKQGGSTYHFPTLAIESVHEAPLRLQLSDLNQYDMVIFVSQTAVLHTIKLLPSERTYKITAMGPATAQVLENFGMLPDLIPKEQFNSEQLLLLPYFKKCKGKKIMLITGKKGSSYLEDTLRQRGAAVQKVESYTRVCPPVNKKKARDVMNLQQSVIISMSGESLQNLVEMMNEEAHLSWVLQQTILVVSNRIKAIALQLGFQDEQILVSHNATIEAILDSLIKWYATS